MGKLYLPITGSAQLKNLTARSVDLAVKFNRELVAIHVINQELVSKLERYKIFIEEESSLFTGSMKNTSEKYLNYVEKAGERGGIAVKKVLLAGDPYQQIVEYIEKDNEADKLICIAKKGGGEYMKDIFMPVERKILLHCRFDIIVIGECV